ncbi:hypothetical protein PISMIDRAFT_161824 [Pisolithus microcarpus 441]|uniref:Uncharacterized protein n=1 Tax=Pisolithus microcarpus 441 TaxID=765257 RepID=A0A0C9ZNN5_9AGAM|nr:hypothetical protein PISMIDRAFT_161824 [Pisolithus microcarpus 441]
MALACQQTDDSDALAIMLHISASESSMHCKYGQLCKNIEKGFRTAFVCTTDTAKSVGCKHLSDHRAWRTWLGTRYSDRQVSIVSLGNSDKGTFQRF